MKIEKLMNIGFSGIKLELSILEMQSLADLRDELHNDKLSDERMIEILIGFKNFLTRTLRDTPSREEVIESLFGDPNDADQYLYDEGA